MVALLFVKQWRFKLPVSLSRRSFHWDPLPSLRLVQSDFPSLVPIIIVTPFSQVRLDGCNIFHSFTRLNCFNLRGDCSDEADLLRFLVRCFPQGVAALSNRGETPHSLLRSNADFGRRFLLMQADKQDPSSVLLVDRSELRRLNYEERKLALFAFFSSTREKNIFTRIRWASDGDSLMRVIVRFL